MDDDNWCIDLEGLCLPDDAELIEAEEGSPRQSARERGLSDMEDSKKEPKIKKKKSRGKSQQRTSSDAEDSRNKGASYGIPFNFSLTSQKKSKATTDKDKQDTGTVYSEEEAGADRNNRAIQANVFMISGCQDSQTSADVSNVSSFSLPNPNGRAGGACTSALLKGKWSVAWSLVEHG